MALVLKTGGGSISLLQNGAVVRTTGTAPTGTIANPSQVGTTLIAIVGNSAGAVLTNTPVDLTKQVGWVQLANAGPIGGAILEVWIYENNVGGITSFVGASGSSITWEVELSEWTAGHWVSNWGANNSTSGTTLALTGSGVAAIGTLTLAIWVQLVSAATATFTSPLFYSQLATDGPTSSTLHIDIEFQVVPVSGTPNVTMTSNRTTTSSVGIIANVVAPAAAVDQSAFIEYGSMTMKLNTLDFALIDPATMPAIGDNVTVTTPSWSGKVVSVAPSDIVNLASGHKLVRVTATNATVATPASAPYGLSDAPNGSTTFGYRALAVVNTLTAAGVYSVYGTLTTQTLGFAPGQTFNLTSSNLGYSAQAFLITNVTITWDGAASISPSYFIEFGTAIATGFQHLFH